MNNSFILEFQSVTTAGVRKVHGQGGMWAILCGAAPVLDPPRPVPLSRCVGKDMQGVQAMEAAEIFQLQVLNLFHGVPDSGLGAYVAVSCTDQLYLAPRDAT